MARHKPRRGRALAIEARRLADALGAAQAFNDRPAVHRAKRRLASFQGKLTTVERTALLAYLDAHDPVESASAILLGTAI